MTIKQICEKYRIKNYTINGDTVDVNGDVHLSYENLKKLPLKFGTVTGNFYCHNNELMSLDGAPKKVGENFHCSYNNLTSLEGAPKEVCGSFWCYENNLTSLKGAPKKVDGTFYCHTNNIASRAQCALIDAKKFRTDFGDFKVPQDKHKKIKWIFENDD